MKENTISLELSDPKLIAKLHGCKSKEKKTITLEIVVKSVNDQQREDYEKMSSAAKSAVGRKMSEYTHLTVRGDVKSISYDDEAKEMPAKKMSGKVSRSANAAMNY